MEGGIQYLRKLAVLEVIYDDLDTTSYPKIQVKPSAHNLCGRTADSATAGAALPARGWECTRIWEGTEPGQLA